MAKILPRIAEYIRKSYNELQNEPNDSRMTLCAITAAIAAVGTAIACIAAAVPPMPKPAQSCAPKYVSSDRVTTAKAELDPAQEGLEQLLKIDGQPYTLQKRNGEPTLVKYEKKE